MNVFHSRAKPWRLKRDDTPRRAVCADIYQIPQVSGDTIGMFQDRPASSTDPLANTATATKNSPATPIKMKPDTKSFEERISAICTTPRVALADRTNIPFRPNASHGGHCTVSPIAKPLDLLPEKRGFFEAMEAMLNEYPEFKLEHQALQEKAARYKNSSDKHAQSLAASTDLLNKLTLRIVGDAEAQKESNQIINEK